MTHHIHPCHPETTEIIANAEHALEDGEITREQRNDVIMACIAAEMENCILQSYEFRDTIAVEQGLHPTSETLPDLQALSTPEHSATSQS